MSQAICNTILDVRREPKKANTPLIEDPLQETQLLPGERVLILKTMDGWAYIEAPEQPCFKQEWAGYRGWVEIVGLDLAARQTFSHMVASHGAAKLSIGTKLAAMGESEGVLMTDKGLIPKMGCFTINQKVSNPGKFIVDTAGTFLGMPYQWGGRSSYLPDHYPISSVDCSGLVNLCYLMVGMIVPRNAHDQWLRAKPLEPNQLQSGDLFFTAKAARPERITHVMIFKDEYTLIEASSSGGMVQEISLLDKFGGELRDLRNGIQLQDKVIFSGSLL